MRFEVVEISTIRDAYGSHTTIKLAIPEDLRTNSNSPRITFYNLLAMFPEEVAKGWQVEIDSGGWKWFGNEDN